MKYFLLLVVCLGFVGCSQKELLVKKEYIEIQSCKIVIPDFLLEQKEVLVPVLKDNSEAELVKVKQFIVGLLDERENDRIRFLKIKEIYHNFRSCTLD